MLFGANLAFVREVTNGDVPLATKLAEEATMTCASGGQLGG